MARAGGSLSSESIGRSHSISPPSERRWPPVRRQCAANRRAGSASRPRDRRGRASAPPPRSASSPAGADVRRQPGEQCLGRLAAKAALRQTGCRTKRSPGKPGRKNRMSGKAKRADQVAEDARCTSDERLHQHAIGPAVVAERTRRFIDRAGQDRSRSVVERMGKRQWRLNPFEPIVREWKIAEERRRDGHRVDRRTNVMLEARRVSSAVRVPPPIVALASKTRTEKPRACQRHGCRQSVRPGADDDCVQLAGGGQYRTSRPKVNPLSQAELRCRIAVGRFGPPGIGGGIRFGFTYGSICSPARTKFDI